MICCLAFYMALITSQLLYQPKSRMFLFEHLQASGKYRRGAFAMVKSNLKDLRIGSSHEVCHLLLCRHTDPVLRRCPKVYLSRSQINPVLPVLELLTRNRLHTKAMNVFDGIVIFTFIRLTQSSKKRSRMGTLQWVSVTTPRCKGIRQLLCFYWQRLFCHSKEPCT